MIMTATALRDYITSDLSDEVLEERLAAIEGLIRSYTNNPFVMPGWGQDAELLEGGLLCVSEGLYSEGDTLLITHSKRSDGLYTVSSVEDGAIYKLSSDTLDDKGFVNLVYYPPEVKMGAVLMLSYDLSREGSEGVKSETISRHSVEWEDSSEESTILGYPMHIASFLKSYRKARRY